MNEKSTRNENLGATVNGSEAMDAVMSDNRPSKLTARSDQPVIKLIGAGGAGINIIKQFINTNPAYTHRIQYDALDTSESNLSGLEIGKEPFIIDKNGSGKVRATNANAIQDEISSRYLQYNQQIPDICIICFSMAGGSGSVIAPLLAKALAERACPVILIGILDSCSKLDTVNSARTLQTLSSLSVENGLYFPLMLFANMGVRNRRDVDSSIMVKLRTILEALIDPSIAELDLSDKLNFVNPLRIDQATAGCYTFDITSSDLVGDLPGEIQTSIESSTPVFSSLAINAGGTAVAVNANVAYIGLSEQDKTFTAVNGLDLNVMAIEEIMLAATRFDSLTHAQNEGLSKIDKIGGKKAASGLIL